MNDYRRSYLSGIAAYKAGQPPRCNPHNVWNPIFISWEEGWWDAWKESNNGVPILFYNKS